MPRKATWALIIWSALMALWAVSVTNNVGTVCTDEAAKDRHLCEIGANLGGGIGLVFIVFVWLVGFMVFTVIWFMSRPQRRLCPVCGNQVKKGVVVCDRCGYDFRALAGMPPTPVGPPLGWGQQPPAGPPLGWGQQPPAGQPLGWGQQPPAGPPPGWAPPPQPPERPGPPPGSGQAPQQ